MQTIVHEYRPQDSDSALARTQSRFSWFWLIAATLVATASVSLAQAPFTEVENTGDLALDYYYNFGASWGDYDNDGDMDLFIATGLQQPNFVYRNNGDLTFTRMTSSDIGDLGTDAGDSAVGIWADIDNDGDLDMYVANYSAASTLADYNSSSTPPAPDVLYVNNGDNTFTRQPSTLFGPPYQFSDGASMADFDGNGFLDIMTTTYPLPYTGPPLVDVLFQNDGNLGFTSAGGITRLTKGAHASWADFDGDGDMDVLVTDFESDSVLYVNQKTETGTATFIPLSQFTNGVTIPRALNGLWGDYDNDGDWDFVLNHHRDGVFLFTNEGNGAYSKRNLMTDPTKGGRHGAWLDYDNDGDLDLVIERRAADGSDGILLLENLGGGEFTESEIVPNQPAGVGHRLAVADVDNDGFTDVFIAFFTDGAVGSPDQERDGIWRNNGNTNHWLKLVLKGTESNRSAVGSEIRVRANINGTNVWQLRQVSAGESWFAQNDPRPNFGLGDATVAEVVRIEWPSGTVQELANVAADQILHVTEPARIRVDSPDTISWPASAEAFQLESASNPDGPWANATESITVDGNRMKAAFQTTNVVRFYRLHMP